MLRSRVVVVTVAAVTRSLFLAMSCETKIDGNVAACRSHLGLASLLLTASRVCVFVGAGPLMQRVPAVDYLVRTCPECVNYHKSNSWTPLMVRWRVQPLCLDRV